MREPGLSPEAIGPSRRQSEWRRIGIWAKTGDDLNINTLHNDMVMGDLNGKANADRAELARRLHMPHHQCQLVIVKATEKQMKHRQESNRSWKRPDVTENGCRFNYRSLLLKVE